MERRTLKYISNFIQSLKLDKEKLITIGVSGGVDSMTLLYVMKKLDYKIQAVHINHGTRHFENLLEEKLVSDFCLLNNIKLDVYKFENKNTSNFEMEARKFRYKIFKSYKSQIVTAHHIDDSFEWHLMQKFRSSSRHQYGIPARNKNVFRPFMCLTKKQICYLAKDNKIPFLEDSSNNENNYERNYIRNILIPMIAEKYPNYLKHYVNQMNNLTKKENIHLCSINKKKERTNKLHIHASYDEIEDLIKSYSSKKRGKISNNLNALMKAIEGNKRNFQMNFSGGVTVKVTKNEIFILNKNSR